MNNTITVTNDPKIENKTSVESYLFISINIILVIVPHIIPQIKNSFGLFSTFFR